MLKSTDNKQPVELNYMGPSQAIRPSQARWSCFYTIVGAVVGLIVGWLLTIASFVLGFAYPSLFILTVWPATFAFCIALGAYLDRHLARK